MKNGASGAECAAGRPVLTPPDEAEAGYGTGDPLAPSYTSGHDIEEFLTTEDC